MRLVSILLIFLTYSGYAQYKCATDEITRKHANINEAYARGLEQMDSLASQFESGLMSQSERTAKKIIIPVVVHVVYRNEEDNIGMEQIHSQIDVLNRDFNWQQEDKYKIPELWRDLGAASGFEFRLADRDPDGNFTNGVTRKQTDIEDIANVDNVGGAIQYYNSAKGGTDPWYQPHYLNIWVCEIGDRVLGYTYLPSANEVEPNDGIVIEPRAFGTTGRAAAPYTGGRTLVHEMGRYFGLRHLWGDEEGQCTNTDYMDDTPWQAEPNFKCSSFPSKSCPSEPDGDMFMNFMDYADDTCSLLFTKNQIEYMQLVIRTAKVTLIHSEAVTGVSELGNQGVHIFPNPSSGVFQIIRSNPAEMDFFIYNSIGDQILTGKTTEPQLSIDLTKHAPGIYFFKSEQGSESLVLQNK